MITITNDEDTRIDRLSDLRQRAEHALRRELANTPLLHSLDVEKQVHEIQVYQIELEIQNEELRQAQVQLSESRDQFSDLYDFAPVGYLTIGINGLIEQANLTSATMLGIARTKLVNQPLSRFVFPEDQDLLYQHRRHVFGEPRMPHKVELRLLHDAATPFYVQLESRAVGIMEGNSTGYRTIVSDISVRKQNEEALLVSNQQLTTTLEKLYATQATLVKQERLAAVGQLAAGIAHDFNNILAVISNCTELLLLPTTLETYTRNGLVTIKEQTESAARLVQQMLDFSRQSTMLRQTINLGGFLDNAVKLLSRTLPANIQLSLRECEDDCLVNADITQLQQVLLNLVKNACDMMLNGGTVTIDLLHLDISAREVTPSMVVGAGAWAMISVVDSGPGIAPEVLPHIFEPFFTTKGANGSGLGLAQVYGIIKQHGGEIEVVTAIGKGTSFIVYLPRIATTPIPSHPIRDDPLATGNGETILIVDDNKLFRETLAELLEFMDYRVLSAANGTAALKLYLQHRAEIALVITDLTMPNISGIELTRALRYINPQVKVIIATGHQPDSVVKDPLSENEATWLQKPISINLMRRTIARMLQVNE